MALEAARRRKERTFPEPTARGGRARLIVLGVEVRAPPIWWGPPRLADSSAEAIDGRTLWYLLNKNLA